MKNKSFPLLAFSVLPFACLLGALPLTSCATPMPFSSSGSKDPTSGTTIQITSATNDPSATSSVETVQPTMPPSTTSVGPSISSSSTTSVEPSTSSTSSFTPREQSPEPFHEEFLSGEVGYGLTLEWCKENYMEHYFPEEILYQDNPWENGHASRALAYITNKGFAQDVIKEYIGDYKIDLKRHIKYGENFDLSPYYVEEDPSGFISMDEPLSGEFYVDPLTPELCFADYGYADYIISESANSHLIKFSKDDYVILTEDWTQSEYDDIIMISSQYDPNFARFIEYNNGLSIDDFLASGNLIFDEPGFKLLQVDQTLFVVNDVSEAPDLRITANSNGLFYGQTLKFLEHYYWHNNHEMLQEAFGWEDTFSKPMYSKLYGMFAMELDDMTFYGDGAPIYPEAVIFRAYTEVGVTQQSDFFRIIALVVDSLDYALINECDIYGGAKGSFDLYGGRTYCTLDYLERYICMVNGGLINEIGTYGNMVDVVQGFSVLELNGIIDSSTSVVDSFLYNTEIHQWLIDNDPFGVFGN